ncbi:Ja158.3 [Japanese cytomegalovirus]|nr:Ja158.3 [Japanese cytomegalovirus]
MNTSSSSRFLGVALLLMTLIAYGHSVNELYCQCTHVTQGISANVIKTVTITSPTSGCDHREIILTLKDGRQTCLNPHSPLGKKLLATVKH